MKLGDQKLDVKNKNIIIIDVAKDAAKNMKTQQETYDRDWKLKKYVRSELDGLTFAIEFLNDRLRPKTERLTREITDEIEETRPDLDDNEKRFESLKRFHNE